MKTELWAVVLVFIATSIGSFGPILIKKGSEKFDMTIKSLLANRNIIFGGLLYFIATVLFIPALKGGDLSVLYPLISITYVWVALLSIKFLNEKMNRYKWLGILFIMIGVAFIGMGA